LPEKDVAGILIETIQGEGGYVLPAKGFYPALRELCDKNQILLIVDEVQSGMGRTGRWWAIENYGIEPDIVCVGKGVASGVPLGGIIAKRRLVNWTKGSHGNTFGGNPIACAAALATIDLIETSFMQNAAVIGEYALDALEEIKTRHPTIGDVRGLGLMIGVEFVQDQVTHESDHDLRDRIIHKAFEGGLLTLGCGESSIRIAPALNISQNEMDEGLKIFEGAIALAERERMTSYAA
jgi:4-aminobutyrate aminotransferase